MLEILATEIVLKVVAHATASAHARASHDDGPAVNAVYCNRVGGLSREVQSRQGKRIMSLLKQLRGRWLKAFLVAPEDFRG